MKRILQIVPSLNINAGMMSVIMNYYRRIDREKIQFDFLYMEEMVENHKSEIEQLGGRVFYIPYPTFKSKDQERLRAFFNEHRGEFTAVHCHPIWASVVIAHEAKRSGIKHIIQHSHSTKFAETKKSEIRNRLLLKAIGLFATDYMACSPEAAYLFGKRRVRDGKVTILPNAIDLNLYTFDETLREKVRSEFHCSEKTLLVGNVGRLSPQKNQTFVLDVFCELHQMVPDSKLLIVGEGNLREDLEAKILNGNMSDSVIMTGKRRDIKAILSGLDLFLMPSLFEGAPVSAIEARTAGLPCVISDTITKSIEMDGVKYFSLYESPVKWAEASLLFYNGRIHSNRSDCSVIGEKGFDIMRATVLLENYYLSI